ncbi:MAG: GatB/YqeY domain-containing protein [Gemmatimonadetes bacterium]|nr:GatB/YqeY domain-containing protein [Gemmatimonadota bacterium]MYA11022.1 GatB/YqeY domain-containing protein [Gemmatimonadota bacterium]MYD14299.1 GatB/YqeY domain-containing protein [Gemmatimonadota bacterium]MYE68445.1 GatB/YqeY domain-containing protein [Gemmatimonadota bacterium]MYI65530.1 GatB/YqeY domain-containing protein [Gemmatimonadota bacterium]
MAHGREESTALKGSLKDRLRSDLNEARRARDRVRTLVLSTTLAELRNREIETGGPLDDDGVRTVVARAIKQRRDAAAQMKAGGREELAAREREQELVLTGYLPPELSAEDVRGMVRELIDGGAGDIGAVMGGLMPRIRGRFDGRAASAIVREELG